MSTPRRPRLHFFGQRRDPHLHGAGYETLDYASEELRDLISVIIITVFRTLTSIHISLVLPLYY